MTFITSIYPHFRYRYRFKKRSFDTFFSHIECVFFLR
jgi:hypothetical protein